MSNSTNSVLRHALHSLRTRHSLLHGQDLQSPRQHPTAAIKLEAATDLFRRGCDDCDQGDVASDDLVPQADQSGPERAGGEERACKGVP